MRLFFGFVVTVAFLGITTIGSPAPAADKTTNAAPDVIFVNGDIYTQASPPHAEAIAVREGRIVAVGSNDDVRKLKGSRTQMVDLGGRWVMPGFNDAHSHLEEGGLSQMSVDVR